SSGDHVPGAGSAQSEIRQRARKVRPTISYDVLGGVIPCRAGGRSSVVPEDSPNTSHLPMATGLPAWHFDDLQTGTPQDAREVGQHHDRSLPLGYGAAPVIGTGEIAWRSADHLGRGASVFPSGTTFSLRTRRSLLALRSLRAR